MRVVIVLCALAGTAAADDVADLVAKGQALGKQGNWTQAIDAFKAADRLQPKAEHACLIALAYTRREAWGQAEIAFATCKLRATLADPAPDWLAQAEDQLAGKIAATNTPAITIALSPPANARVAVSGFSADETFTPRTIHLAPGRYTITAILPGRRVDQVIVVEPGTPQIVTIDVAPKTSRIPLTLYISAGVLAAGGLAYDLLEVQPVRRDVAATNGGYETERAQFDRRRDLAIGVFAAAAVTAVAGVVLHYTLRPPVEVGATATAGGLAIEVAWRH